MECCEMCIHSEACKQFAECVSFNTVKLIFSGHNVCKHFHSKKATIYLPCEIGATLYEAMPNNHVWKRYVEGYHLNTTGRQAGAYLIAGDGMGMHSRIKVEKLGKTVFSTHEEAQEVANNIDSF